LTDDDDDDPDGLLSCDDVSLAGSLLMSRAMEKESCADGLLLLLLLHGLILVLFRLPVVSSSLTESDNCGELSRLMLRLSVVFPVRLMGLLRQLLGLLGFDSSSAILIYLKVFEKKNEISR
jgi:hypothetical protein